jgi:hypothetical protein
MKSDTYVVSVEYKEGFEVDINGISKVQSGRDEPRTLIAAMLDKDVKKVILVYELIQNPKVVIS